MKFTLKTLFLLLILLLSSVSTFAQPKSNPNIALIYNGKYADADGAEAMAKLAARFKLDVKYFSNPNQLVEKLPSARIIVIGGTVDDINPFITAFTPDITKAMKAYLNNGGLYLGICGGAYIASTGWEEDDGFIKALALIPVETDSYSADPDPKVISVKWKNVSRAIYYQFGPNFFPADSSGIKVIARYDDGSIAACVQKVGKGKVFLCGPHPEADESWIEDEVENADAWRSTRDLADDVMNEVLGD